MVPIPTHTLGSSPAGSGSQFLAPPHSVVAPPAFPHAGSPAAQSHFMPIHSGVPHSPHAAALAGSPAQQAPFFPTGSPGISQSQLEALIEHKLRSLSHSPTPSPYHCSPHGAPGAPSCGEKGKLKTNQVTNSAMAARFGVSAQPMYEIVGDLESGDISKMAKVLTAGHDKTGSGMVLKHILSRADMIISHFSSCFFEITKRSLFSLQSLVIISSISVALSFASSLMLHCCRWKTLSILCWCWQSFNQSLMYML